MAEWSGWRKEGGINDSSGQGLRFAVNEALPRHRDSEGEQLECGALDSGSLLPPCVTLGRVTDR